MINPVSNTQVYIKKYSNENKNVQQQTQDSSTFSAWLNDEDKVCTDGLDDGKLSFGEALTSFGKGLAGIVKTAIKHPIATVATIAAGAAVTVATGGAALPVMVAAGATMGGVQIGYGAYKAATAETDAEAKQAFETIGNGTFALATSALGAKTALRAASNAGVSGVSTDGNVLESLTGCFKATPEALKTCGANIKGNVLTWTTGNIHANSNALRSEQVKYMSKPNEAQAYRFNPNGSEADILKNNPGVFRGQDGNYYVANKWNPDSPHLINTNKEQMIMMYGPDDMAVCDAEIFNGSYVDTAAFKSSGALNYQNPTNLEYGQVVDVTKQAPGSFKSVATGTKVQTLEGVQTVNEGQVIAIDHAGNPYVTPASNIAKRNVPLEGYEELFGSLTAQNKQSFVVQKILSYLKTTAICNVAVVLS